MKITRDNEVYKSFKELQELKEKIQWRGEYLKMDREFFEQLKRSEFKNESALTVLRKLKELYSSDKKSEEQFNDCSFLFVVLMDNIQVENNSRQTLNGRIIMSENTFTQEQVDEMIKERIVRERKKFESEKKELEKKHRETIEEYE